MKASIEFSTPVEVPLGKKSLILPLASKSWLSEASKRCYYNWLIQMIALIYLSNQRLDLFHQSSKQKFHFNKRRFDKKYISLTATLDSW